MVGNRRLLQCSLCSAILIVLLFVLHELQTSDDPFGSVVYYAVWVNNVLKEAWAIIIARYVVCRVSQRSRPSLTHNEDLTSSVSIFNTVYFF